MKLSDTDVLKLLASLGQTFFTRQFVTGLDLDQVRSKGSFVIVATNN